MSALGRSFAFLAIYMVYLLVGGYIFHAIECPEEISMKSRLSGKVQEVMSLNFSHLERVIIMQNLYNNIKQESAYMAWIYGKDLECMTWSVYNSLFFAFTCITTIGYGTQTPTTQAGRGACLFYSIIGIPINSILICCIGNFFKNQESTKNMKFLNFG